MPLPLTRPDLRGYATLPAAAPGAALRVTFLGTTSLLFDDGETALLTDGFVTRPPLRRVAAGRIAPDPAAVDRTLRRLGVDRLAAVVCAHSHYDHALDAPAIAARTGADLVGSTSTANVGRGGGLAEEQLRVVDGPLTYGTFGLTFAESVHSPGDRSPGTIDAPLVPPARVAAWRTGSCYSVFVAHGGRSVLVHASANVTGGALAGRHADVVYLGIGTLGRQPAAFRERYWDEVVTATGARRVVPVHWDDFFRGLDRPLVALRRPLDDAGRAMDFLVGRGRATGVDVALPVAWRAADPFAGL